eukprot:8793062-Karenia_brevis.AAC.1
MTRRRFKLPISGAPALLGPRGSRLNRIRSEVDAAISLGNDVRGEGEQWRQLVIKGTEPSVASAVNLIETELGQPLCQIDVMTPLTPPRSRASNRRLASDLSPLPERMPTARRLAVDSTAVSELLGCGGQKLNQ